MPKYKNKTEVIVNVTASHIKRGVSGDSSSCPVALALRGKKYTFISVNDEIEFVNRSGSIVTVPSPKSVAKFIDRFDDGKKVKPFSFKLSY
jgi:hypothetical protein